jgi:predicted nuclease of predicted toxin-antitoxin system
MALLYTNENFPVEVVEHLRALGHDVLSTHDAGKSNQGIEDEAVLRYASEAGRCVVTLNRKDFMRLHRAFPDHAGIVVCTENRDFQAFAARIHEALELADTLNGKLLRVVRGQESMKQ